MAWPVPCRFSLYRLKQEDRDMSCRILANIMLICLVACSDTSTPVTEEIPTSGEIEVAIDEANYCDADEDCEFVHSCWCGAVANVAEVPDLQDMIAEWLEVPENAENCATSDCMGFSHVVCEESACVAIANE
jgi:hypothetical protein